MAGILANKAHRAVVVLSLLVSGLAAPAAAQGTTGRDATVPRPPPAPRRFLLDYEGATRYLLRDGDPGDPDAPYVLAVAGGAKLWFDGYFLTARNVLVWLDPEDPTATGAAGDTFPYGVQPPLEQRVEPALESFADPQDPHGPPPRVTTGRVREVYAEGDVYITQGETRVFQAAKAYFNVLEGRSLVIDGEIRTDLASLAARAAGPGDDEDPAAEPVSENREEPVPIVIRAAEIRGVSKGLWEAENATVTTCTFAKPGYHIAMDRVLYEEHVTELGGRVTGYGNRFVLGDVPLLSLPYFTLRTGTQSPFPLIGAATGVSSQYGLFLETRWGSVFEDAGNAFNRAIGVEGSFEGLWFADINYYGARGPGLGAGLEYETKDGGERKYFGKTEGFFVYDYAGDDETARQGSGDDDFSGFRGYFQTQNRIFLPDDWQLDTELYWVSDRNFLKEFREEKVDEEKAPETYVYLKKQEGDAQVTGLVRYRLNDWQTQTSYLPQFTYDVVSRPIAEFESFGDAIDQPEPVRLYWTHRSEAAIVNRGLGDFADRDDADGTALRVDDVERLNLPFEVGDFGIDPYLENRLTLWLGDGEEDGGGAFREGLTVGYNASMQYWKTDADVESTFWNIHGVRHIVIPNLRHRYTFVSTVDSQDLVPYDDVEHFDRLHVVVPGVLSRYQTKRMTPRGPETVTFLEFDVQQPFILENARDDDIDFLGDLHVEARWRPDMEPYLLRNSTVRFGTDLNWNDAAVDQLKLEFVTEPGPDVFGRVAYSWARRGRVSPTLALDGFVPRGEKDEPLNSLTFEVGYQATRRWEFVILQQFDFATELGVGGETRLIVRRRTHDWVFELGIGSSGAGAGLGITVTPVAFFEREERDRFKTALSDGYDLTPIFDEPRYATGRTYGAVPQPPSVPEPGAGP